MVKKSKIKTPDWILKGEKEVSSKKKTGKTFKVRICPKCGSDEVGVVLSGSDKETGGGKEWECRKCKWKGKNISEREYEEEEFMAYLDEKGEDVA